jgi:hypothetical protein
MNISMWSLPKKPSVSGNEKRLTWFVKLCQGSIGPLDAFRNKLIAFSGSLSLRSTVRSNVRTWRCEKA